MRRRTKASGAIAILVVGVLMGGLLPLQSVVATGTLPVGTCRIRVSRPARRSFLVKTVDELEKKWEFTTGGDVSATPAVEGDTVYFPDWAGNLYAVDKWTGQQKWSTTIVSATGVPGDKARATPAIAGNKLIIGTQGPFGGGGKVLAFNKKTGALIWSTTLDDNPAAIITQSATVNGKVVYVGTSSQEEGFAALIPGYPCCSFRGKMAALDLDTGAILWETVMTPEGFPGNAVWGSSPASTPSGVDSSTSPPGTTTTHRRPRSTASWRQGTIRAEQEKCLPADNYFDSVLALDLKTGAVRWVTRMIGFDAWTVDCIPFIGEGTNCPEPAGPDFDFWAGARSVYRQGPRSNGRRRWRGAEERPILDPQPGHGSGSLGNTGRPRWHGRRSAVGFRGRRHVDLHRQPKQQPHPVQTTRERHRLDRGRLERHRCGHG